MVFTSKEIYRKERDYTMNRLDGILILSIALVVCSSHANGLPDDQEDWSHQNMYRTNLGQNNHQDFFIDDQPQEDMYYSSGDGYPMHDDLEEFSGDNADFEGSAEGDSSPCLRLKKQVESQGLLGLYIPQCTQDGGFEKTQCRGSTGVCWCVDLLGREITGTKMRRPEQPDCDSVNTPYLKTRDQPKNRPGHEVIDTTPELPGDDDFFVTERTQKASTELSNVINNMAESDGGVVEIDTVEPNSNAVEGMMSPSKSDLHLTDVTNRIMSQPGILAGIIGGALVGLLCAVLLVMFIVYRMRKKDEGSYALDERKQYSPSMHQYARAPTKEFYA